MSFLKNARRVVWCALALSLPGYAGLVQAQEAVIRKNLSSRVQDLGEIDSVLKTSMPGLYEVRVHGTEIYYTDASGNFLIKGNLVDTRNMHNLTAERTEKLTAIRFADLPFKDSFTIVHGNGERKVAIFEDPNCGFCKRFEKAFQSVDNVTAYVFLYPVLGPDSITKAKNLWCTGERGTAWDDWILHEKPAKGAFPCDTTALDRNLDFGQRYRIEGTPTLLFADNSRHAGAVDAAGLEKLLSSLQGK